MKIIALYFGLLCTVANSFSQQQGLVPAGKEPTQGSGVVNSNSASGEEIMPASSATLRDYEQHPEHWYDAQLLTIALGYVCETNIPQAIASYKKFLSVRPNNMRAIRGLGTCYLMNNEYELAVQQFKRGWTLGDDLSLKALAYTYCFELERYQEIKPLIVDLLKARERLTDPHEKYDISIILIGYSLGITPSGDKDVFTNGISGLSDDVILKREDTAALVLQGLDTFGEQNRAN